MPAPDESPGQAALPGLDDLRDPAPGDDPELAAVATELTALDGDGSRMAAAIRGALDMLLDGQHTGRYRWDQLHKTEKTHAGTLVEIALARYSAAGRRHGAGLHDRGRRRGLQVLPPAGRLDDPARG